MHLSQDGGRLVLRAQEGELRAREESQLAFWGFRLQLECGHFAAHPTNISHLAAKVKSYLEAAGREVTVDPETEVLLASRSSAEAQLAVAVASGYQLKEGDLTGTDCTDFFQHLRKRIPRRLKPHQVKAALHLLSVRNGANFSVPGSGKTTVVLVVFDYLRHLGEVDSLFVVGPPSCFEPWRAEYEAVLGRSPDSEVLAGGEVEQRRSKYLVEQKSVQDLYLTTFQTLQRDWEDVRTLFHRQNLRFYFVADEAHYIKQPGGIWANAVLNVAPHARFRAILTGTPFPRSYSDGFNLFDVLWPTFPPIPEKLRHRIVLLSDSGDADAAANLLDGAVGPLFYRVRKAELDLAPQIFHPPLLVDMKTHERRIYDAVLDRIETVSQSDYLRDFDLRSRLQRGRIVRLRQCISYAALLDSALEDPEEGLLKDAGPVADAIANYRNLEVPGKLVKLLRIVAEVRSQGEKILIWSNFIRTLELIREACNERGFSTELIYGATPTEAAGVEEERSREGIIRRFLSEESGLDVLAANPAACAESISLHKSCSHAIYYDLSYNGAQYLQSLDRIHRVGGSENKSPHYHFLQYKDTIDQDILANLQGKAARMSRIIDQDYAIYGLDMFAEDEELEAYERLFGSD